MSDFLPDYFGPIKSELRLRILTNLKILTNLVTKLEFIFRSIWTLNLVLNSIILVFSNSVNLSILTLD